MCRWAMPALSNTPASRSNSALRPPNSSRALAFASDLLDGVGRQRPWRAREGRRCPSKPLRSRPVNKERSDEPDDFASGVVAVAACAACQSQESRRSRSRRAAVHGHRGRGLHTPWAMAFLPGERRAADQHGAADRKGGQAVAGRCRHRQAHGRVGRSGRSRSGGRAGSATSCRIRISPETGGSI